MTPIEFTEANTILRRPPGVSPEHCMDLPIHRSDSGVVSCWQPSKEEIRAIALGAPIYLMVRSQTHPPLNILVESPFVQLEPTAERVRELESGALSCRNCGHFIPGADPREGMCGRACQPTVWHYVCDDHQPQQA